MRHCHGVFVERFSFSITPGPNEFDTASVELDPVALRLLHDLNSLRGILPDSFWLRDVSVALPFYVHPLSNTPSPRSLNSALAVSRAPICPRPLRLKNKHSAHAVVSFVVGLVHTLFRSDHTSDLPYLSTFYIRLKNPIEVIQCLKITINLGKPTRVRSFKCV